MQQLDIHIQFDKNTTGLANFIFRIRNAISIRSVNLDTLLRPNIFYIIPINTSFLLYLADMDKHRIFFKNITNQVIESQTQPTWYHPVIKRYGHAFLLWYTSAYTLATESLALNPYYFMDIELWHLYCRFEHPLVHCLYQLLERLGYNDELQVLQYFIKYCEQCQKTWSITWMFCFYSYRQPVF